MLDGLEQTVFIRSTKASKVNRKMNVNRTPTGTLRSVQLYVYKAGLISSSRAHVREAPDATEENIVHALNARYSAEAPICAQLKKPELICS